MIELPLLTSENQWLEMKDGEQGVLLARLNTMCRDGSLLLSYADRGQITLEVRGESTFLQASIDRLRQEAIGKTIRLLITRYENGIFTTAEDILALEIVG